MGQKRPRFRAARPSPWPGRIRGATPSVIKLALLAGVFWGLVRVAQLDVSALAPRPQPMPPAGSGAEVRLYDDGRLYLKARAGKLTVDSQQETFNAEGLTGGVLIDKKGKLRGQFSAGRLHYERTPGNVALEGGVALSASEGDIISAATIDITKADKKLRFPAGISWKKGVNHLSATEAESDGQLKKVFLRGGIKARIHDLDSLALSRSRKTLQKRKVNSKDILPLSVQAAEGIIDEELGTVDFTGAVSGSPVLHTMKHYRLTAGSVKVFSKAKTIQAEGDTVLVRPARKEKTESGVAQAFAGDPATVRTQSFNWFYDEERLDFPLPVRVNQPKREVSAGTGTLDDKNDVFSLSGAVVYHQKEGPWAKRLKDFQDMDKDGQDILTGPMELHTEFMNYNLDSGALAAGGGVRVQVKERNLRGQEVEYEPGKKIWRLRGRVAYREHKGQAVFTSLLTLDIQEKRTSLQGRTRILLNPSEKMKEGYEDMAGDPLFE